MNPAELKQAMRDLDWSQADLARRLNVHPNTVSKWITGKTAVPGAVAGYVEIHRKLKEIIK